MTEIGFSPCRGTNFSGMDSLIDAFWMDPSSFLDDSQSPPFYENNPNSPGSTKSTSSLNSLLHAPPSGQSPPLSPWKNDFTEGTRKDLNLEEGASRLWHSEDRETCITIPISPGQSSNLTEQEKNSLLPTDLLHAFDDNEASSASDLLEEQLASADNAWTAVALEFPALATEDVSQLLMQASKPTSPTSHLHNCRKRRLKRHSSAHQMPWKCSPVMSDAESTDTGSEGEEDNVPNPYNARHMLIAGRVELVEDLCSNESEEDDSSYQSFYTPYKIARTSQVGGSCRENGHLTTADFTEPWWPQRQGAIHQRLNSRDADVGRSRRQLELWEFILRSLDADPGKSSDSAFKWVDRSIGVFRVTDTNKAAKEWGLYRGNARMDYEKMARAMRFYYKEYVLRKARKQLHFQFSMPFVAWSKRQHSVENVPTSTTPKAAASASAVAT